MENGSETGYPERIEKENGSEKVIRKVIRKVRKLGLYAFWFFKIVRRRPARGPGGRFIFPDCPPGAAGGKSSGWCNRRAFRDLE